MMTKDPIDAEARKQRVLAEVGYGKPPRHSQFQKGKSGNPLGRPRKTGGVPKPALPSDPLELVQAHLTRKITAKDGSGAHQVPAHLASVRMIEQGAADGSVQLRKTYYNLTRQAELEHQARLAEDHAFWTDYIRRHTTFSAALARTDPRLAAWLPAPEDIIITPGQLGRYRGAITADEAKNLEHLRLLRDALIIQISFDIRTSSLPRLEGPHCPALSIIPPLIGALNRLFPARIVLQGERLWDEVSQLASDPSSLLEQERRKAWAGLGVPPVSVLGQIPFEVIRAKVERILKAAATRPGSG